MTLQRQILVYKMVNKDKGPNKLKSERAEKSNQEPGKKMEVSTSGERENFLFFIP